MFNRDLRGMSTTEVTELTDVARSSLSQYASKGVINPRRASSSDQSELRWTFDQAWLVSVIPGFIAAGLTLSEIGDLAEQGVEAVLSKLEEHYMANLRASRRGIKSLQLRKRELSDTLAVGKRPGDYLRYIPQRYLALAPIPDATGPASGPQHNPRLVELMNTVRTMGWCHTNSYGFLSSISADSLDSSFFGFNLLAAPPMPTFTGMKAIDGGCYKAVCADSGTLSCNDADCAKCSRFGRNPSQASLFEWNGRRSSEPGLWNTTIMVHDLDEPYRTGLWSEYTKERFGHAQDRTPTSDGIARTATVRPRLMPHEVPLPLGITACVLPAGVYLCRQCEEEEREKAFERVLGQASIMTHREFTVEDEIRASENAKFADSPRDDAKTGPVPDPFAEAHITGNPALAGWWHELTNADIRKLVVPTNMALAPQDGYCVICAALPVTDFDAMPRYEMQLLVDTSEMTPPPSVLELL